jgi:hypothetical protein
MSSLYSFFPFFFFEVPEVEEGIFKGHLLSIYKYDQAIVKAGNF